MNSSDSSFELMDVTLRDGSYIVDFQFSKEDTAIIAGTLEKIGIRWIEIGHGVGLNGSNKGYGVALATDDEYMEVASQNLKTAKWGFFFIPGIGTKENLINAKKYNPHFVRIGSDITNFKITREYIELAKELGYIVTYNGMKSYAVSPKKFAETAKEIRKFGADIIYLVDSAGGLLPDDIKNYFTAVKYESDIELGFHGHDNLSLAMANTLVAIECGAKIVDTSLQGLGRSAGNAITEVFVAIMKRKGYFKDINLNNLLDLGYNLIQPLLKTKGVDPLTLTSGYARFHSSYIAKINKYSEKYNLDRRELIVRLCQEDVVNAPDDLLESLSNELAHDRIKMINKFSYVFNYDLKELNDFEKISSLLQELKNTSSKYSKYSAINIIRRLHVEKMTISKHIHTGILNVIGSVTIPVNFSFKEVFNHLDGKVDNVLLDIDYFSNKTNLNEYVQSFVSSKVFTYSDTDLWIKAVYEQVKSIFKHQIEKADIICVGKDAKVQTLVQLLQKDKYKIRIITKSEDAKKENYYLSLNDINFGQQVKKSNLVIFWDNEQDINTRIIKCLNKNAIIFDAGLNSLSEKNVEELTDTGYTLLRVNMWPAITTLLLEKLETNKIHHLLSGRRMFNNIPIIAGCIIGKKGDIIVDDIKKPTRILGIANGRGGILDQYDKDEIEKLNIIKQDIITGIINANI